jgi:flagellin-like protein
MLGRKGITPIIATILVVMMTVAAAGAMFFWLTRLQGTGQGAVEESQTTLLERMAACVTIPSFSYNTYDNTSDVSMQNCGNTVLEIGDGDDNVLVASNACSFALDCDMIVEDCPITVGPGAYDTITIDAEEADCSGGGNITLADVMASEEGIQHQFILTVGTRSLAVTTTARSFVPRYSAPASIPPAPVCGVSLTALIPSPQAGPRAVCFPYNLNNTGGTNEIYNVSITSITGPCGALLFSGSLSCSGPPLSSFVTGSIPSGGVMTFSLEHGPPAGGICTVVTRAVSTTNASCLDTDTTITSN